MSDLYNSILATYAVRFNELKPKAQFHFASRLHLWCREPMAETWLQQLRPRITANGDPKLAVAALLRQEPPPLRASGSYRQPFFDQFPELRQQERVLFRLLFLHTVYGLPTQSIFYEFFEPEAIQKQREQLLADADALRALSSFGVNFIYLLDRFVEAADDSLPVSKILAIGQGYDTSNLLQRQLNGYFYTHAIIAESLFYARSVPAENKQVYSHMLAYTESLIRNHFDATTLDSKYEYLVCCRLLDQPSSLETAILQETEQSLSPEGYIIDPRLTSRRPDSLHNAKHRNVLFLLSQRPFQPLA